MKQKVSLDAVLTGIQRIARQEIRQDFRADSCIASTRVVCRVFRYFGYEARPFSVRLMIFNKAMTDYIVNGDHPGASLLSLPEWVAMHPGAWSVGIGGDETNIRPNGYNGHLIALLPQRRLLIDASIDQGMRPEHKIFLPSVLALPYPETFEQGESFEVRSATEGITLIYEPIKQPWQMSRDWSDKSRTKRAMRAIIGYIEEEICQSR